MRPIQIDSLYSLWDKPIRSGFSSNDRDKRQLYGLAHLLNNFYPVATMKKVAETQNEMVQFMILESLPIFISSRKCVWGKWRWKIGGGILSIL